MATEARDIQKHVLPNGLVVLTETMSHVRSVSVGVWIRNGSRREVPEENGLAHFMEHMVFKGTERRSAEAIAREMDSVGGMLDAFTSKEQICFNAKVLDEHLPIAFDVIADLVLRPKFDSEDVRKERQVVLEEIKMDLDNPEYLLHEIFTRGFWPEHPLGRPILGTPETVRQFNRDALRKRFQRWFAPDRLVISAAGNVGHERVLELVEREFGGVHQRADSSGSQARPGASARLPGCAVGAAGARAPLRGRGDEQSARWRHVFAAVPEHPRKTGPGLRRF
jgi:predicted Zn-dependent peptidase